MSFSLPLPSQRHLPGLSLLVTHYIAGRINTATWRRIMNLLDDRETTADEREALALFLNDAVHEIGAGRIAVPKVDEVQDVLTELR